MSNLGEQAMAILDELHTERLAYESEYVPLADAARTSPYAARDRAVLLEVKRDLVRLGYHCEHYYERGVHARCRVWIRPRQKLPPRCNCGRGRPAKPTRRR